MTVIPLGDRIFVQRVDATEAIGSIIVPEKAREKPQEGVVIAVGPGSVTLMGVVVPVECKVGDRVLFGKYTGVEVKILDDTILILREQDLLGILR